MHLVLDGIPGEPYLTPEDIRSWMLDLPARIGMTRISPAIVEPVTGGMAAIVLIAESHVALHYLPSLTAQEPIPEAGMVTVPAPWAHVDVFTCRTFDPDEIVRIATAELRLRVTGWTVLDRGLETLTTTRPVAPARLAAASIG